MCVHVVQGILVKFVFASNQTIYGTSFDVLLSNNV